MNTSTDELRLLLRAGTPKDGNLVPLYSAMRFAKVLVRGFCGPYGPEPLIVGEGSPSNERLSLQAYTDRQEAAACGVQFDFELVDMVLKEVCRFAANHQLDAVDINRGGYGYSLNYTGMIDLLSGQAPVGDYATMQIEQVRAAYEVPAAPPSAELIDEIRESALKCNIQQLSWCCVVVGDAPPQLCFVYRPHPNHTFNITLLDVIHRWFNAKMTFTTHDLAAKPSSVRPECLATLPL